MALNLKGQLVESWGSKTIVGNAVELDFLELEPLVVAPPASAVVASVEQTLLEKLATAPAVSTATAVVTATMPPAATLSGAAQVRAAQGDPSSSSKTLVVDFQGQRTVAGLTAPQNVTIKSVAPWLGTMFQDPSKVALTPGTGGTVVSFEELQTERLLVTLDTSVAPATFAQGAVVIPTPPSNLELLVNGTRAWFNPGPAAATPYTLDITGPVATAAAMGQAVVLTLRAAAPANLTLAGTAVLLKRYLIAFPEGMARTVDAASEGVYPLSLPISTRAASDPVPASASAGTQPKGPDSWLVKAVLLDVSAKIPPSRVVPADGPPLSTDAELVLDPDHAVVVRMPPGSTGGLAAVTGVRLLVAVGSDGAELAGTLHGNTKVSDATRPHGTRDEPADSLPKARLGPVTLTPSEPPAWIDLALAAPHQLAASEVVWLELQLARGSIVWKLALPQADDANAELRRRSSSGKYVELSTISGVTDYAAALRVVGPEKPNDPLAAVQIAVAGGSDTVSGVPTQAGTTMMLALTKPGTAPTPLADGSGDFEVPLELTISTPGSYAITSAELQYTQPSGG